MNKRFQKRREHRRAYRYSPVINRGILRRGSGDSLHEFPIVLESISTEGCRVRTRRNPTLKAGDLVRVLSPGIEPRQGIEGRLVSIANSLVFGYTMRIQFVTPLTYDTFMSLVYGPEKGKPTVTDRPEHETDQFWR